MAAPLTPPLSFGALLKRYRRLARLTQEQLAERAGFGPSHISMLERGERMPVAATVEMLAAALELEAAEREAFFAAMQRMVEARVARTQGAWNERWRRAQQRAGADDPPLPVGGFLGATPDGALVAREAEMGVLLAALDAMLTAPLTSAGRLVMISGEPGIGKTRLAQEVALRARERGVLVAVGRCYEQHQTDGFYLMSEALGHLYAAAPARLRADAAQHWPHMLALLPNAPVAAVSSIAGAATAGATNGPDARRRLYRQLTGFVEAVAASRPVALLLDDVHWADAASLDCLLYVARHTRG
ncbi:MAG: AAA family ATPase, partial [Ktedonobacterales bacterium]